MPVTKLSTWRPGLLAAALLAAALLAALATAAPASAQTMLRWKFREGETLNYTMDLKTVTKLVTAEQTIEQTMNQVIDTTWRVKGVTGDVAEVSQTIDRIRSTVDQGGVKIQIDSKEGKAPAGPLQLFLGKPITFKVDSKGEVSDIKLPEGLSKLAQNPQAKDAQQLPSQDQLKDLIAKSTLSLPDRPVAPGTTWQKKHEVQSPLGTQVLDQTYTFEGVEAQAPGKPAKIGVTIHSDMKPKADLPIQLTVKSQSAKGLILFDTQGGHLNESRLNERLEYQIKAKDNKGRPQEFTQQQETDLTMKLTKAAGG